MAFSTIGVAKQKGGSVGSSGRHNDRERDTPNADPSRSHLNRVVLGEEGPVRETVNRIIDEHGGKPRHDSVEAIELLLSASHEYFVGRDGEIDEEKTERFVEQAVKFLSDRRNCGICAKAVLHLDERTPHIHAHMVPITEDGRLSASKFIDGREMMKELHTRYASYMEPLGLERGREGSRATHQRVKQFYASVTREPELKIDPEKIPDPARLKMLTADGVREYKLEVLKHVLDQVKEPIRVLQDQAQLTRDEHAHRVEAEKRAREAEREAAERYANLERSSKALKGELKEVTAHRDKLIKEKFEFSKLARERGDRLEDIPMPAVMEYLGYQGESRDETHTYRAADGQVALTIKGQKAYDSEGKLICRNSLDLVIHMRRENEGIQTYTMNHALTELRDGFGEQRAAAAYVVNREQHVYGVLERDRAERGRELFPERNTDPFRGPEGRREDHDRGGRGHDAPVKGGDSDFRGR